MGPDAEDVLQTTGITAEERAAYASVIQKFDDHFGVHKNIIYERARFNTRKQQPGESGEQYILALYTLAANCEYTGEQKEQAIRDRLVVGIRDIALSKQLQMDLELTLEKAKKLVRQREAVNDQTEMLAAVTSGSRGNPIEVEAVTKQRYRGSSRRNFKRRQQLPLTQKRACTRCRKGPHARAECPAREMLVTCHRCRKRGHFSAWFLTKLKSISQVQVDGAEAAVNHSGFLDAVSKESGTREPNWTVDILVGKQKIQFKLDTGAEVTAMSDLSYRKLQGVCMSRASRVLFGPDHTHLNVL